MEPMFFNYNANKCRLTARCRDMARLVLVDGLSQSEVARRYGVKQPRVAYLVKLVKDPPERNRNLVRIGGLVDADTAAKVRAVIAQAQLEKAAQAKADGLARASDAGEPTYAGSEIVSPDDW